MGALSLRHRVGNRWQSGQWRRREHPFGIRNDNLQPGLIRDGKMGEALIDTAEPALKTDKRQPIARGALDIEEREHLLTDLEIAVDTSFGKCGVVGLSLESAHDVILSRSRLGGHNGDPIEGCGECPRVV